MEERVPVAIVFQRVLETLAREIYDTPLAFLRENVQNAVDAIRVARVQYPDIEGVVEVTVAGKEVRIRDNGVGMTRSELQDLFWTMGASGKNTPEARQAGCIGTFGIGGFANFGVCDELVVISKKRDAQGYRSSLAKSDFPKTGAPEVTYRPDESAGPQGTLVVATLSDVPDTEELKNYLKAFVRYAPEQVLFNGTPLSGEDLVAEDKQAKWPLLDSGRSIALKSGEPVALSIHHDDANSIIVYAIADAGGMFVQAALRFENGPLQAFKRGFKLCNVTVQSVLGVSGRVDADFLQPTAGRDSLSAESHSSLTSFVRACEHEAINEIVQSSELLAANARVLSELVDRGRFEDMALLVVPLADGSSTTLGALKRFAEGGGKVYFGRAADRDLLDVLQRGGNRIVTLASDSKRRRAEQQYLERLCSAVSYEGLVEIKEVYDRYSVLELAFLGNLEMAIQNRYDVRDFKVVGAALSGGVPVFVKGGKGNRLTIYVDVRHQEIRKLEPLGQSILLYTMATEFCKTYLGSVLKSRSPKYFGAGALSFDDIVKRTSELWEIASDDIDVRTLGMSEHAAATRASVGLPQRVVAADVQRVEVGREPPASEPERRPKILHIVDRSGQLAIEGYYFRLMDAPARVFGDDLQSMTDAAVFWFGNRVTYAFSDSIETAFHYELRLQHMISAAPAEGGAENGGMLHLDRPIQDYNGGMFLPVPQSLEGSLVPTTDEDVIVRVNYEWFDLTGGRTWSASDADRKRREDQDEDTSQRA